MDGRTGAGDGGEYMSETQGWYGGTERSTPICGECGFFRPDAQRTGSYRLGWCAKRAERHDRCDLMPECSDGYLGNPKYTREDVSRRNRERDNKSVKYHSRRILCVTTGRIYKSITDAAESVKMRSGTLSDALLRSKDGQVERKGKIFKYFD